MELSEAKTRYKCLKQATLNRQLDFPNNTLFELKRTAQ